MQVTTVPSRGRATAFPTLSDADVAIMQYRGEVEARPDGAFSVREYRGDGYFVLVETGAGELRWLTQA